MLQATVRKYTKLDGLISFVGRVDVISMDNKLYSHSTGIHRLTKEDALLDAIYLQSDLERTHHNIEQV